MTTTKSEETLQDRIEAWQACVGPGWSKLVKKLIIEVEALGGSVHDVKEKFGGLRSSCSAPEATADEIFSLEDSLEAESLRICEECGAPGAPRPGGWIKTLCEGCYELDRRPHGISS